MTASTVLDVQNAILQELPLVARRTLGEQQLRMALAALTPRVELVGWPLARTKPAEETGGLIDASLGTALPEPHFQQTVRCPYCQSMTYEVSVQVGAAAVVANGECSLCGTRGVSFRPGRT
jgi:hypothetical protein